MFQGGVSVSRLPLVIVDWLTAESQRFQKARVANFPTSLSLDFLIILSQRFQKARVANFPTSLSFYSCVIMGREYSVQSGCTVLYWACL